MVTNERKLRKGDTVHVCMIFARANRYWKQAYRGTLTSRHHISQPHSDCCSTRRRLALARCPPSPLSSRVCHSENSHTRACASRAARPAKLFGVQYSELTFALSLDWAHIVATVNVESAVSHAKISAWIARWEAEHRKSSTGVDRAPSHVEVLARSPSPYHLRCQISTEGPGRGTSDS